MFKIFHCDVYVITVLEPSNKLDKGFRLNKLQSAVSQAVANLTLEDVPTLGLENLVSANNSFRKSTLNRSMSILRSCFTALDFVSPSSSCRLSRRTVPK